VILKHLLIIFFIVLVCPVVAFAALSSADGQAIFDEVFWKIMQVFCVGLTAGLAIKFINRS